MNSPISPSRNGSERGAAIVEAAIIMLMFFLLMFGVMEAGRFMQVRQVLTDAAREGARLSVAPLSGTNTLATKAEVDAVVDNFLTAAHITGSRTINMDQNVSVTTGLIQTTYTRVQVQKTYSVVTIPGFFSGLQITLRGEALMRNETSD